MQGADININMSTSTVKCKRKMSLEVAAPRKSLKSNRELNFDENITEEELEQVSDPSMHIDAQNILDIISATNEHFRLLNQQENVENYILPAIPDAFQKISVINNPFMRKTIFLSAGTLCPEMHSSLFCMTRPLDCKTIFVTGFPTNTSKSIIKEIFEICGSVNDITMSGKEDCFVTFSDGLSVEKAVFFSGYRLTILVKNELDTGILYICYGQQKCNQDLLKKIQIGQNFVLYQDHDTDGSEYDSKSLIEKLKNKSLFSEGLKEFTDLLKQKKVLKKSFIDLYPIMQAIHIYVLHLTEKKEDFELNPEKSKSDIKEHVKEICKSLDEIAISYKLSQEKNNWFNFTKRQKNNIKLWESHCSEYKALYMEEFASHETNIDEESNQSHDQIKLCNDASKYDLMDLDGQIQENTKSPNCSMFSPVPFFLEQYTDNAASLLCEKLTMEDSFSEAIDVLMKWYEEGACNAETALSFFFMIQCIHNFVIKLHSNKNEYEEKLQGDRQELVNRFKEIVCVLEKIERAYLTVTLGQSSYYFISTELKSIELWKKYARKLRFEIRKRIYTLRYEIKVDANKQYVECDRQLKDQIEQLKQKFKSLRSLSNDVHNSIANLKQSHKRNMEHLDAQLAVLRDGIAMNRKRIRKLKETSYVNRIEMRELRSAFLQIIAERESRTDLSHS